MLIVATIGEFFSKIHAESKKINLSIILYHKLYKNKKEIIWFLSNLHKKN